jgi:hypothetical protein
MSFDGGSVAVGVVVGVLATLGVLLWLFRDFHVWPQ